MAGDKATNQQFEESLMNRIDSALRNQTAELKSFFQKFQNEVDQLNNKIANLEARCEKSESRYLQLERSLRKNNLVVFGLKIDEKNIRQEVASVFNRYLNVELSDSDFKNVYLLGKNAEKTQPIKVEFMSFFTKQTVLKNCSKLKGTDIHVVQDLCEEDRLNHKILVQHLKEAKNRQYRALIRGNKLIVNGNSYTVEQLSSKEDEDVVVNQDIEASRSAPSTPTPRSREKNLEEEFGLPELALNYVGSLEPALSAGKLTGAIRKADSSKSHHPKPDVKQGEGQRSNSTSSEDRTITRGQHRSKRN